MKLLLLTLLAGWLPAAMALQESPPEPSGEDTRPANTATATQRQPTASAAQDVPDPDGPNAPDKDAFVVPNPGIANERAIDPDRLGQLESDFARLDDDGDRRISMQEAEDLAGISQGVGDEDIFRSADTDSNGFLDPDEFTIYFRQGLLSEEP